LTNMSGEELIRHRYEKFKSIGAVIDEQVTNTQ